MKFYLLSICIFLTSISYAQDPKYKYPVSPTTRKITYENTITVQGTKEKLFKRAEQFLAVTPSGRFRRVDAA